MELFQAGDSHAFDELYRRHSQALLRFMYRMLNHNEPLAQDLLHDVFMKLIDQPMRFDISGNFKSWIFTVAANECRKQFRQVPTDELSDHSSALPIDQDTIIEKLEHEAFKHALRKELQALSYDHRCTFILRFQEKLDVRSISEIMQCSEGTVKSRTHYCLKHLAHKLAAYNTINLP